MPPALKDFPITTGTILRWSGFFFFVISSIVSISLYGARISGNITSESTERIGENNLIRLQQVEQARDISDLKRHQESTDKDISDINRKLDVCVAVLDRIEKRLDNKEVKEWQ